MGNAQFKMQNTVAPSSSVVSPSRPRASSRLWLPQVWLYVPAYMALVVALGAACRALAHFITNPDVALYLWSALVLNSIVSFGVQCGGETLRQWSHRGRIFLFLSIPVTALLFNASILAPLDAEAEINASVALIVGWASIVCVLLVGSRYGDRRLPFAAPLVPGLSLFGLLNSLSVDTLIQICFLVFVAASLYLVVYEPLLNRFHARERSSGGKTRPKPQRFSPRALTGGRWPQFLSRTAISRTAVGYLAACSAWFAAFLGGAALFYYPVEAVLPRIMAAPLGAVRGASAALLDWRGASPVMELRGGNYPLSDRAVMQVEIRKNTHAMKTSPVLWRGRIYEKYDTSRWVEVDVNEVNGFPVKRRGMIPVPEPKGKETLLPRLVRQYQIQAVVHPERNSPTILYFPGELHSLEGSWTKVQQRPNGTYTAAPAFFTSTAYAFRSNVKDERLSGLQAAPGLSAARLQQWRENEASKLTLEVEPELRAQLAPIIQKIEDRLAEEPKGSLRTPYAKANAIRDYLVDTCRYSLSAPLVPATEDAVVYFMTKSKQGACDMFASSMVMLLRSMNVPARLATGYIEPEELTEGRVTTGGSTITVRSDDAPQSSPTLPGSGKDNSISFTLREKDAHAWVEYYIPGAGWLTYDPTAGTRTTQLPLEAQIATMLNLPSLQLKWQALWLPLCGVLLIGLGLGWTVLDARSRQGRVPLTPEDAMRARICATYDQAVRLLKRHVPGASHLTPREFEAAVNSAPLPHAAKQEFAALTYLVVAARYTQAPPVKTQEELQASLRRLRQALQRSSFSRKFRA